jgi:leucyl/phenylalanyl-tRNA--protein transferase
MLARKIARTMLVAAVSRVLTNCTFAMLGRDRARRAALRISLWSSRVAPPTPADVIGNYIRGWIVFGHAQTPELPFRWQTFPQRAVITPATAQVPKRIRRMERLSGLEVRFDVDYDEIVEGCRRGRDGMLAWLTDDIVELYRELHRLGYVATIGAYRGDVAVAGLWGLQVGGTLGIMSLFHTESDSGKVVTAAAVDRVIGGDRWSVLDFGRLHPTYARFGAVEIPRDEFCELVVRHLLVPTPNTDVAEADPTRSS